MKLFFIIKGIFMLQIPIIRDRTILCVTKVGLRNEGLGCYYIINETVFYYQGDFLFCVTTLVRGNQENCFLLAQAVDFIP